MDTEAVKPLPAGLEVGSLVDGWHLDELLHTGGMAHLWRVSAADRADVPAGLPLIMKVPRIMGGQDPASIVEERGDRDVQQPVLRAGDATLQDGSSGRDDRVRGSGAEQRRPQEQGEDLVHGDLVAEWGASG
mgnify:CR=1 FL=1